MVKEGQEALKGGKDVFLPVSI